MTNANDLLWWNRAHGDGCTLIYGAVRLHVERIAEGWRWKHGFSVGIASDPAHATREAAMQAAVDAAEAAGVDFSKAPRWKDGDYDFGAIYVYTMPHGEWGVETLLGDDFVRGQAPTESLARTAAIAALRREVQELVEKAKGELGV